MDNTLEIRQLTDRKQIREIYKEHLLSDFPENEVTPWKYMNKMLRKREYACYGLFRGNSFLGYAFFVRQIIQEKRCCLLDYLAVVKEHRNEGLGSRFLHLLGSCIENADCVIAEVEDPDAAEEEAERETRVRRIRFYERNGCRVTNARAMFRGEVFRLMEIPTGPVHTEEEMLEIYESLYRQIAPAVFLNRHFQILH